MTMPQPRVDCVLEARNILGEGPVWDRRDDRLYWVDIRAPQSGTVHQLAVHTVEGVIAAGDPIMLIVPSGDTLVIEARIAPQDIDQVRHGQPAFVRFPAFNQRTTPAFSGVVSLVAADLTREPHEKGDRVKIVMSGKFLPYKSY